MIATTRCKGGREQVREYLIEAREKAGLTQQMLQTALESRGSIIRWSKPESVRSGWTCPLRAVCRWF